MKYNTGLKWLEWTGFYMITASAKKELNDKSKLGGTSKLPRNNLDQKVLQLQKEKKNKENNTFRTNRSLSQ